MGKHCAPTLRRDKGRRRAGIVAATVLVLGTGLAPGAAVAAPVDDGPEVSDDWKNWQSNNSDDDSDVDVDGEGGDAAQGGEGGSTGVQCQSNSLADLGSLLQDGLLAPGSVIPIGNAEDGNEAPNNACGADADNDAGDGGDGGDGPGL